MFYREAGQFKTSYKQYMQAFPIREDRIGIAIWLAIAFFYVPFFGLPGLEYTFAMNAIMIPVVIFTITAIGLNILVGFTGQISLGTGAFMGVGAYACYKLTTYFPDVNIIIIILASGFVSAAVGAMFGLPSLRIKGFYLVVATLAAQFFLEWCFIRVEWLYNYNPSGAIEVPQREVFGVIVTGAAAEPATRYLMVLGFLILLTIIAGNLVRGRVGRGWMMIRDMDIAAELIGVRPLRTKLSAFAVSSYYCGVSGALMVFVWLGAAEVESFDVNHSFLYLFMVIFGGLGSITGSYMGAAFIWTFPILMKEMGKRLFDIDPIIMENVSLVAIGALIVFILIKEPHGLARLWQLVKQKLRIWPFAH